MTMKKCQWCKKATVESSPYPDVCELCHSRFIEKKQFVSPMDVDEETSEAELRALASPYGDEAEAILDARIKRMTQEIQDSWTPEQAASRRVQKKTGRWISVSSIDSAIRNSI